MRWEDERYVRFYVRDTVDWLLLSFEAQALFGLLLRKVDRAGLLPLGRHGKRAVAVALGHAGRWDTIAPALDELLNDGCIQIQDDVLVIPNFIEAQEATQSDAQRQREHRGRARDLAAAESHGVTKRDLKVTKRDQTVTSGHAVSQAVTPNCAVPSVPSVPTLAAASGAAGQGEVKAAPVLKLEPAPARKPKSEPDPRHQPVKLMLARVYAETKNSQDLPWGAAHGSQLSALLKTIPDVTVEEFERRWRYSLGLQRYPGTADALMFFKRWAELVPTSSSPAVALMRELT